MSAHSQRMIKMMLLGSLLYAPIPMSEAYGSLWPHGFPRQFMPTSGLLNPKHSQKAPFSGSSQPKCPHLTEIPYVKERSCFLGRSSLKKIFQQWITYLFFPITPVGRPCPVAAGLTALFQDTRAIKMDTFSQVCHPMACQAAPRQTWRGACPNWQLLCLIITCTLGDELFCVCSWPESHPHQLDITVSIVNNNLQMEYSRS